MSNQSLSWSHPYLICLTPYVAITKNNFQYYYAIGKGGFGKVWKVEKKKCKELYAMKEMSKARIISKRSVKSVMNERMILSDLKFPYVKLIYFLG